MGRRSSVAQGHQPSNPGTLCTTGQQATDTHHSIYTTVDGKPLWELGKWMFFTSVVLGLVFGLFSDSQRSPLQVSLVLCIQVCFYVALRNST